MGFWSPHTLVADARRHGVVVRNVDINASDHKARIEPLHDTTEPDAVDVALRLGISYVRSIGEDLAKTIAAGRPYTSVADVIERCNLSKTHAEALATSGAFSCFEPSRRKTLWTAGAAANAGHAGGAAGGAKQPTLPGMTIGGNAPDLPEMSEKETAAADLWATSMMPNGSPIEFVRPRLEADGVITAAELVAELHGRRITVAGVVTHRQRPSTAGGVTFLNLEDETGLVNVICPVGLWKRYRRTAVSARAMVITGRLEHVEGVANLLADKLERLDLGSLATSSRDFR
jgi:error-prone DNA polymerase